MNVNPFTLKTKHSWAHSLEIIGKLRPNSTLYNQILYYKTGKLFIKIIFRFNKEIEVLSDTVTQIRYGLKDLNFNMVTMNSEIKDLSKSKIKFKHAMAKRNIQESTNEHQNYEQISKNPENKGINSYKIKQLQTIKSENNHGQGKFLNLNHN